MLTSDDNILFVIKVKFAENKKLYTLCFIVLFSLKYVQYLRGVFEAHNTWLFNITYGKITVAGNMD